MRTTPPERIEDFTHRGWWGEETLATVFDGAVEACPDRLALVDQFNRSEFAGTDAQRLTFAEAAQRVENMAAQLHANGIGQDDIVVVQLPNIVELALLYVAAAKLGVILSPAPVQYGLHELGKISEELNPRAFITLNEFKGGGLAAGRADAFQDGCSVFALGREAPVPGGAIPLDSESVTAEAREAFGRYRDSIAVSANDVFTICWTSGTTGQPKGVPRSHNMWLTSAYATFDCVRFRDGDVFLNPFPLVNMASIGGFLYNWLLSRSTLVLHHPLDLQVFMKQIETEKVTYTIAPPAILTMLLKNPELMSAFDLSSVRVIGSGGAPLSPWMVREYQQAHGIVVVNIFGSNEGMALISGSEDVPDPEDRAEFFPRYGVADFEWNNRVADRMKTRLQDVDTAEVITRPGRPGELLIWGASVFDGYYNAPETNRSVFTDDGFFHTGDLFEIACDGEKSRFYRFVGRCKDIIVRGGVKISPDEIDNLLAGHPKLVEAAVVGYADEVMEERVCAAVVPKPGESVDLDDITGFLRSRNVAVFKLPERLLVLDQLPRNPLGKVLRNALKEMVEGPSQP
jgi:acyl-CoA synthetase (AMP-forming)/AMP-acid ligase II